MGPCGQQWRLSRQTGGTGGYEYVSCDHGVSKCLWGASYRRWGEEGEEESASLSNVFVITSNTICRSANVEGRGQLCGVALSLHFYVGPRDQTQPTVCWTQTPKSTSVLSDRMGLVLFVCSFLFFVERSLPASGFNLPVSLRPDLVNSWELYSKDENQLPQVCPLIWKHVPCHVHSHSHFPPINQSIYQSINKNAIENNKNFPHEKLVKTVLLFYFKSFRAMWLV